MIVAVLDTNVIVSGLLTPASSPPSAILDRWRDGAFDLILSDHILVEVERTLGKPFFRRRMTAQQAERSLQLIRDGAFVVPIVTSVSGVASQPADDLVLATATSGGAGYLVTGDKQLLLLDTFLGITILTPRAFLDVLEAGSP